MDSFLGSPNRVTRSLYVYKYISVFNFVPPFFIGTTVSLSRLLQSSSIDLKKAMDAMKDTMSVLQEKRRNVNAVFEQLFSEAKEIAEQLDVQLRSPRIVSKQIHRANNQPGQSVEEYFRRAIYTPLLDCIITDLEKRLSPEVLDLFQFGVFLPKVAYDEQDLDAVKKVAHTYQKLIDNTNISVIINEYKLWVAKWKREIESGNRIPENVTDVIENCDKDLYPNIKSFLSILATLPVSIATAERSFSTLRRLKSWIRASMDEERLTGLALMNIHHDIKIDPDDVITRFSHKKRKLEFVI